LYPLNTAVVRIGSDPSCSVRLDNVEQHALTLERRSDEIRVHNRTSRPVPLGNQVIAPNSSREWPRGGQLELSPGYRLKLVVADADGQVERTTLESPAVASERTPGGTAAVAEKPGAPSRLAAVVPLLLVTIAVWLAGQSVQPPAPVALPPEAKEFADLVGELRRQGDEGVYLAQQLQVAEQEKNLGRYDQSRARLLRVRDRLLQQRARGGPFEHRPPWLESALGWIVARL
jgi:hypothetical protein